MSLELDPEQTAIIINIGVSLTRIANVLDPPLRGEGSNVVRLPNLTEEIGMGSQVIGQMLSGIGDMADNSRKMDTYISRIEQFINIIAQSVAKISAKSQIKRVKTTFMDLDCNKALSQGWLLLSVNGSTYILGWPFDEDPPK